MTPEGLLVTRDTISVCKWCAAALGLTQKENKLERRLEPTPTKAYDAVYLYSPTAADRPKQLPVLAQHPDMMDEGELVLEYIDQLMVSALSTLVGLSAGPFAAYARRAVKRASIAVLNWLFATPVISNKISVADSVIRLAMAGASACLNSSVIPFITGKASCRRSAPAEASQEGGAEPDER